MRQFSERTIKVDKKELLTQLKKNANTHASDYHEAHAVYVERWLDTVSEMLQTGRKTGSTENLAVKLVEPVSYYKDYIQIIEMLEMSVDDTVEISASEFQSYVKDNWDWKKSWASVSNSYTGKAYV